MALIKCSECGTEVSDRADKCPKCACPISSGIQTEKAQTIELTGKKFKKNLLIGVALILVAWPAGYFLGSGTITLTLLIIGVVVILATKISIWWHHH